MNIDHKLALELAASGEWDAAHEMVQPYSDRISCLIHAYLHRVEGDFSNADYWYQRAGAANPQNTLDEEWQRLNDMCEE